MLPKEKKKSKTLAPNVIDDLKNSNNLIKEKAKNPSAIYSMGEPKIKQDLKVK